MKDSSMFWLMLIIGIISLFSIFINYFYYNYSFYLPTQIVNIGISILLVFGAFYYKYKKVNGFV